MRTGGGNKRKLRDPLKVDVLLATGDIIPDLPPGRFSYRAVRRLPAAPLSPPVEPRGPWPSPFASAVSACNLVEKGKKSLEHSVLLRNVAIRLSYSFGQANLHWAPVCAIEHKIQLDFGVFTLRNFDWFGKPNKTIQMRANSRGNARGSN